MSAQFSFLELRQKDFFGGTQGAGKRKCRRPVVTKKPMHLVLKSSMARGRYSLLHKRNSKFVSELVASLSSRWAVRIFEFSNNGNHLHLLIQARYRKGFRGFVRGVSAMTVRHVTACKKGRPLGKKFWDSIPFTRIVAWGRSFLLAKNYVVQNQMEAAGVVPYLPRCQAVPWWLDFPHSAS
jgi:REP element-mobilizing transposase RayT